MKTLSPADPSPSVAVEGVSLFLDFPAELVGAVAGDSVLSLLIAEVASLFLETASLFPVVVAGFVGAVAGDSALSPLTAEVAFLFLVLVAAPVEVASEAVDILSPLIAEVASLFLDILSLLIEGIVVFL